MSLDVKRSFGHYNLRCPIDTSFFPAYNFMNISSLLVFNSRTKYEGHYEISELGVIPCAVFEIRMLEFSPILNSETLNRHLIIMLNHSEAKRIAISEHRLCNHTSWLLILASLLTTSVALGKLFKRTSFFLINKTGIISANPIELW